jgi:hypothetical protein
MDFDGRQVMGLVRNMQGNIRLVLDRGSKRTPIISWKYPSYLKD